MSELEKEVGNLRNGLKAVEAVSIPNLFQSLKVHQPHGAVAASDLDLEFGISIWCRKKKCP